jgi:hypothetical protein
LSLDTEQQCRTCEEVKPLADFPTGAGQYSCKVCRAANARVWRAGLAPEAKTVNNKANDIWKRYRLRPEQYQELIKDGCAICGTHEDLCVDHDHSCCPGSRTCGKCVRGALCKRHNRGEACFDTINEITALLAYRLEHEANKQL